MPTDSRLTTVLSATGVDPFRFSMLDTTAVTDLPAVADQPSLTPLPAKYQLPTNISLSQFRPPVRLAGDDEPVGVPGPSATGKKPTTPLELLAAAAATVKSATLKKSPPFKASVVAARDTPVQLGKWGFVFPKGSKLTVTIESSKLDDGRIKRVGTLKIDTPDRHGANALYALNPVKEGDLPFGSHRLRNVVFTQQDDGNGGVHSSAYLDLCDNAATTNIDNCSGREAYREAAKFFWGLFYGTDTRLAVMKQHVDDHNALPFYDLLMYIKDRWTEGNNPTGALADILSAYQSAKDHVKK